MEITVCNLIVSDGLANCPHYVKCCGCLTGFCVIGINSCNYSERREIKLLPASKDMLGAPCVECGEFVDKKDMATHVCQKPQEKPTGVEEIPRGGLNATQMKLAIIDKINELCRWSQGKK